jgi:hypothetical protein
MMRKNLSACNVGYERENERKRSKLYLSSNEMNCGMGKEEETLNTNGKVRMDQEVVACDNLVYYP